MLMSTVDWPKNLGSHKWVFYDFFKFPENRHLCHLCRPLVATVREQTHMFRFTLIQIVTVI
jgi:hypothetical protein